MLDTMRIKYDTRIKIGLGTGRNYIREYTLYFKRAGKVSGFKGSSYIPTYMKNTVRIKFNE